MFDKLRSVGGLPMSPIVDRTSSLTSFLSSCFTPERYPCLYDRRISGNVSSGVSFFARRPPTKDRRRTSKRLAIELKRAAFIMRCVGLGYRNDNPGIFNSVYYRGDVVSFRQYARAKRWLRSNRHVSIVQPQDTPCN